MRLNHRTKFLEEEHSRSSLSKNNLDLSDLVPKNIISVKITFDCQIIDRNYENYYKFGMTPRFKCDFIRIEPGGVTNDLTIKQMNFTIVLTKRTTTRIALSSYKVKKHRSIFTSTNLAYTTVQTKDRTLSIFTHEPRGNCSVYVK